jgi:hypothetical protein
MESNCTHIHITPRGELSNLEVQAAFTFKFTHRAHTKDFLVALMLLAWQALKCILRVRADCMLGEQWNQQKTTFIILLG